MSDSAYLCPNCGEYLIKSENNISKNGYMIPTNFFDGEISKRGENHKCPKNIKPVQIVGTTKILSPTYPDTIGEQLHEYFRNKAEWNEREQLWYCYHDGVFVKTVKDLP